ncbi:MAG: hypothetical protein NBV68_05220 [Erythrobacter sp.]|uniref:hypothetical protein n=1 Tax=Erythrobacter sp. TaxID=1042 RepID=UPI0025FFBB6D|nr:hypothetical protein [Erythrobacter sp.]MCL9998759.1 hypothetical protein [Erythrobacter sp.]
MKRQGLVPAALAAVAVPVLMPGVALAQDEGMIVVTGSRVDRDDYDQYYDEGQSAIGLTRKADNFVKPIYVNSDSRDPEVRRAEVTAMLQDVMKLAARQGIALVAGDYKLVPLTDESLKALSFGTGNRPDTTRVKVYARLAVGGSYAGVKEVDAAIAAFVKAVPLTGRSYIETGGTDLAINNPQGYRGAVVKAIADEAKRYAAMFGPDYGIEIRGLDSELYFKQASETEVFLYIEHSFVIRPKQG